MVKTGTGYQTQAVVNNHRQYLNTGSGLLTQSIVNKYKQWFINTGNGQEQTQVNKYRPQLKIDTKHKHWLTNTSSV